MTTMAAENGGMDGKAHCINRKLDAWAATAKAHYTAVAVMMPVYITGL
jgi:hypothetical protein